MIVLSAGMQKSGTGWYFNLTNELLLRHGGSDTRKVRADYELDRLFNTQVNNLVAELSFKRLTGFLRPIFDGHTFVIKTHNGPTRALRLFETLHLARSTYIYRDPRDVVLSLLDHGARARNSGQDIPFARLENLDNAIDFARKLIPVWESWSQHPGALIARYEDLQTDPVAALARVARFLGIPIDRAGLQSIVDDLAPDQLSDDAKSSMLHFNKGLPGRFRSEMTPAEIDRCNVAFGSALPRMGYAL